MQFSEYVKIRPEKFGAVIFETLREKVFVTNPAGKEILGLLEKGFSLEKITDVLANAYDLSAAKIKDDLDSFIRQLKENNILKCV